MDGTDHRSAKNSKLTDLRHALQFEVSCKSGVPAEVGENRERSGRDHRTANGEPVKTVGKIDGVARCDNHKHNKTDKRQEGQRPKVGMSCQSLDHQVRVELLEEWHQQSGGIFSAVLQSDQRDRNQDAGGSLIAQLGARGKSEIAVMNDFKVVIGKTDRAEGHRGKHGDPYKRIAQVRPEQRRHQDGDGDQQTTHGRRARFFLMSLRTLFANVLPNLEIAQALNHDRPNDQAREKSSEAGESCAESQITENAEWRKIMEELQVEQPVEQSASDTSSRFSVVNSRFSTRGVQQRSPVYLCVSLCTSVFPVVQALVPYHRGHRETQVTLKQSASDTSLGSQFPAPGAEGMPLFRCHVSNAFSSFTPRDAFNNTTSPSRVSRASHSPASSGVATNSAFIPASRAASTIGFAKPRTPSRKSSFPSRNISPALAMQLLAGGAEFQHLSGDNNPASRGHGSQSIHRRHKRLRT